MKLINKILVGLLALILIYGALQVLPYPNDRKDSVFKINKGESPLVIGHGGAKLLYPENTIMGFDAVYEMGVDVLETDLCLTKDNVLITHHDLTLDATTNINGLVNDYTYEQLAKVNFGQKFIDLDGNKPYENMTDESILATLVPMKLEEMFKKYGKSVAYIVEIKDIGENGKIAADVLNDLIKKYELESYVCVASFDQETLLYFNSIKSIDTLTSMDETTATTFIKANLAGFGMFLNLDGAGLQLPKTQSGVDLTHPYVIYKIHHNNMFVHYWTINDKETMASLIKKGADGIITDRPDLMFEVIEELGY